MTTQRQLDFEELEQRYRGLMQSAYDAIIFADDKGRIIGWNNAAQKIFGYREEEVSGKPLTILMPPRYREAHSKGIERFRTTGETHVVDKILELHGLRKDGAEFPLELTVSTSETQGKTLLIGVARDTTVRKQFEREFAIKAKEFRAVQAPFQLLVEFVVDYGICMLDPEGHVLTWNLGAERMRGYTADQILGKHFSVFYGKEDREAAHPNHLLQIAKTQGRVEETQWHVRKNGSRFWAHVVISPVYDEAGVLLGFAKVTQDLTRQKQIDQLKSDLIGFAAHQLKSPLTEIYGFIDNMLGGLTGKLNARQKRYLNSMQKITSRHLHLVNDLLSVSKAEAGMLKMEIEPVDLNEIVQDAAKDCQNLIRKKKLKFVLKKAKSRILVLADAQKAGEAMRNALSNAIKFTDKGTIAVSVKENEETGIVEISDTGIGMVREILDQLFTRELILSQTKEPRRGTGLGLFIARSFMRLQRGDIRAASTLGKGSKFTFTLPKIVKRRSHGSATAS